MLNKFFFLDMKMTEHEEALFTIAFESLSDGPLSDTPIGRYRDYDLGRLLS